MNEIRRRLRVLFHRDHYDCDLAEEMQNHLDMQAGENRQNGMKPSEARAAASRQFGNATLLKERSGDVWAWLRLERLVQDVRFAWRAMRRSPAFSAVAITTLALGIGANTAIFTLVNAFLLRPLPFADEHRLVLVSAENRARGLAGVVSFPTYLEWSRNNRPFDLVGAYGASQGYLTSVDEPQRITVCFATATLLDMLGAKPILGRRFLAAEDFPGGAHVALLSEAFWHKQFGGKASVLGTQVRIDSTSYTVIGVLPASFRMSAEPFDAWIAVGTQNSDPNSSFLTVIGHLKPGTTLPRAQAEMTALNNAMPWSKSGWRVVLSALRESYVGSVRPGLLILLAGVAMLLLITSANVMNLLLSRGASRRKEMALRTSLGAGRARLVRQMLTESTLLSLAGGGCGLLLARWGVSAFSALMPAAMHPLGGIHIDGAVLTFTALVSFLASFAFGLAPALRVSGLDLNATLKDGGGPVSSRIRGNLARSLVASEVALALILLIGAGLLIRSFARVLQVDAGFRTDHLLTMETGLSGPNFSTAGRVVDFYNRLAERAGTLPGVQSAAAVNLLPIVGIRSNYGLRLDGLPDASSHRVAGLRVVTANYLQTMGVPIRKGRGLTAADRDGAPSVVVINETMAARFWPGQDPLGKRIRIYRRESQYQIVSDVVGVAGNTKYFGLEGEEWPEMFVPLAQWPSWSMRLVVRTKIEPSAMAGTLRTLIHDAAPEARTADVRTMDEILSESLAPRRFTVLLLGAFALLALSLSVIGLYGVIAYSVAQRQHEIGIRMALGAERRSVVRLILGESLVLTLAGVFLGIGGALALTRLLAKLLFGVSARDPVTFAFSCFTIAGVALLAAYIPARRATRIDPMEALRYE
ncbi:Macrolide transporter ATP-binding /permease protein [Candidatus Sulfopaludibacter sp. SbA3]|nr:Macrolide transporter ATP-binding /permease protein [Candidatus Sulfopaludibacter sp. SbA3]